VDMYEWSRDEWRAFMVWLHDVQCDHGLLNRMQRSAELHDEYLFPETPHAAPIEDGEE